MGRGIRFAFGLVSGAGKGESRVKLRDHMDLYVGTILEGTETLPAAGQRLFTELFVFASDRLTKAEISGYTNSMDIYVTGPVI
jgi:altronate dehydratase large subunit